MRLTTSATTSARSRHDVGQRHRARSCRAAHGLPGRRPDLPRKVLMSSATWFQFVALIAVLLVTAIPLGKYIALVYGDEGKAPGDRVFLPVERLIYRFCRVDPEREQRWTVYAYSLFAFSLVSFLVVYALQRLQGSLPFNPVDLSGVIPHL